MDMDGKAIVTSVATDIVKSGITLGWEKIKTYFKDLDASADIEYRTAYEDYLKNTKDRYGKIKTIIYRRERKDLYSFYEATGISYAGQTLSSSNINNLLEIDSKILVTGTGGIGKSILFKHLFLNSMEVTNFIPVFIELRSLNTLENKELNISNLIFKTLVSNGFRLERKYFDDSLEQGAYIIFLDGFDEIHHPPEIRVGDRHGAERRAHARFLKHFVFILVQFDHTPLHSFCKSCPQSSTSMVPEPSGMVHIPDTNRCILCAGIGRMLSSSISTI